MHKKFEINQTKIKGCCQSGRKVVTHTSKSDLPLKAYQDMNTPLGQINNIVKKTLAFLKKKTTTIFYNNESLYFNFF